jgi:carbonic anhydrase
MNPTQIASDKGLIESYTRFMQGNMLKRDFMQQVKTTASGQFPFASIVGCVD